MSTADSSKDETGITGFEQELEKNLQIQMALNSKLRVSLEPISLEETLHRTLELIIRLRWLAFESRGCIFLVEGEPPVLVMKAHVGMSETVLSTCARVAFGTCLCGRAIALNELTFSSCLDARHKIHYPGVEPHGHYCVPIARGERRIGLLNLYVREGHEPSMIERRFLRAAADVLAGVVERDRVEEALWKSEERFELAQRGTDAGIWDWDLRTNALFFSPKWQRILGHEEGEIGQRYEEWESRLHPDDRDRAQATIRDYLQGKITEYVLEHRLRHKDGSYRWVLARGAMVCDENGKPYRIVGSHLDITERKNVELRLMQREASLIAARNILDHLIPLDPYDSPGLLIQGSRFAADYAPGDYYDYFTLEDGSVMVVIADVSGHGIESALLMSSVQARLRSYAELSLSMEEILRRTNSVLFRSTSEGQFVTMLIVHVDPRSRTLTFANAGHPSGYVFSAAGQLKFSLDSLSMPLALDLDTDFPVSGPILIESGDLIVLVTDGVLEARSGAGAYFGVHRTLQVVRDQVHTPTETILRSVHSAIHDFTGTEAPQDDETIVLIKIR